MREIDFSRRGVVHSHLEHSNVEKAFKKNIIDQKHSTDGAYNDGKSDEEGSLKWTLKQIYHEKCAFCESYIKNEVGDIEHFRPKNMSLHQAKKCDKMHSYFWLAFSWDNLIPSCSRCNGKKSNCFDIYGTRVQYSSEELNDLHFKTKDYNDIEKPKLLHPEHDKFESKIRFNRVGEIESDDERVMYTVDICDLNRNNLKESREKIIGDFENRLNTHIASYIAKQDIEYFKVTIEEFVKASKEEFEYSLVRKYIIDNFTSFLDGMDISHEDDEIVKAIILVAFEVFSS